MYFFYEVTSQRSFSLRDRSEGAWVDVIWLYSTEREKEVKEGKQH